MAIISLSTFGMKRVLPAVVTILIVLLLVIEFWMGLGTLAPQFLELPIGMLIVFGLGYRILIWGLADEVEDLGDKLRVRRGSAEARVSLADVVAVRMSPILNPPRYELCLRKPCIFGNSVAFLPKMDSAGFLGPNLVIANLRERVEQARSQAQ